LSVKEFFYEGVEIILQVYDEQGFLFKGIIFLRYGARGSY